MSSYFEPRYIAVTPMQWTSLFWSTLPECLSLVKYLSKICTARKYVRIEHLNEVHTSTIQSVILVLYSLVTSWPPIELGTGSE